MSLNKKEESYESWFMILFKARMGKQTADENKNKKAFLKTKKMISDNQKIRKRLSKNKSEC